MDIANLLRSSSPLSSPPLSPPPLSPPSPLPSPPSPPPPPLPVEPSTPTRAEMTRDQRIEARTLHRIGWKFQRIRRFFLDKGIDLSYRQIAYACTTCATPKKRSGRPPLLTTSQIDSLIEFITALKDNRRMPYWKVIITLGWEGISECAVRAGLRRVGYKRYVALRKFPISEKNRKLRVQFALEHLDWTDEQWDAILWSDETWVTVGSHRKTYVTRRVDEAMDPTCVLERERKKRGWMFWGCFSGKAEKGPGIFWEKEWGTIIAQSYQEYTVPIIDGWMRLHLGHLFMQDGAPGHAAKATLGELLERHIIKIYWPPFSPDLNPIENVWNWMKEWLFNHYPTNKLSYDQLRQAVKEAWDTVEEEYLLQLLRSIRTRCQAIIDANSMYISY
ncbi:hypothetical protein DSL72_002375 [Monilinia vaccinii-corymbosi]|uniref:Tc1-like transposase DDE domain-containing protein n=1 Tax=Monilinia vaccinii-corymbosi TaxID=61207 RepID=A0A8A3PCG8_9HELO|nr:hypothetical protein DSL72_002375 [Monilinia vaccinii-corymbosi]